MEGKLYLNTQNGMKMFVRDGTVWIRLEDGEEITSSFDLQSFAFGIKTGRIIEWEE